MWYAADQCYDLHDIAMLLVDGPPGHTASCARDPALPLLRTRLAPGALVVLDDTNRADERRTLEHWQQLVPGLVWQHARHSIGQISWADLPN
jgi:hypothetical protein